MNMSLPALQLMSRKACCLCDNAEAVLADFVVQGRCLLEVIDVDRDISLAARYGMDVPVLLCDGDVKLMHAMSHADIENLLSGEGMC